MLDAATRVECAGGTVTVEEMECREHCESDNFSPDYYYDCLNFCTAYDWEEEQNG